MDRCLFNSGWIRGCYGEAGLQKIGSNTVSCSGVTLGTRNAIIAYVSLFELHHMTIPSLILHYNITLDLYHAATVKSFRQVWQRQYNYK
jgi:hypothetical protein